MTDHSHHPREEHSGSHKDKHHRHCFGRGRHKMDQLVVPNSLEHSLVHATWGRGHGQVWDTEQPHHQQDWSAETEFVEEELEMDDHLQNKNTNT